MAGPAKNTKDKGKPATQTKLYRIWESFGQRPGKDASPTEKAGISIKASTGMAETLAENPVGRVSSELMLVKEEIMQAVGNLRSEFMGKLNGILKASEEMTKQLSDCINNFGQVEIHLSAVADDCYILKDTVEKLEKRNRILEDKVIDMETRSRSNNVDLPKGAEKSDCCTLLESWLSAALDMHLQAPIVLERARRIGPKRGSGDPSRPLIMKLRS
ncbi:hypothetical protein ATANTOWER_021804 [Ataeniobius toweri]|uniref:Uncharacterized protein n=1 Tax=Ataeniobius toweri TaxID=208326 RepID=A0ABU7AZ28_9TELE|nr:hypothetical protein [Ataeniobius toweri]